MILLFIFSFILIINLPIILTLRIDFINILISLINSIDPNYLISLILI